MIINDEVKKLLAILFSNVTNNNLLTKVNVGATEHGS